MRPAICYCTRCTCLVESFRPSPKAASARNVGASSSKCSCSCRARSPFTSSPEIITRSLHVTRSHFEYPKLGKLAVPAQAAQVAIYSLRDQSGLLAYCRDAKVRLVRADFLRELLAEGRTMPRRQEAEGMRTKDGRPALLAQEELEAKLPGGQVEWAHRFSVMAVSHSWESREIPDLARFQRGTPAL